MPGVLATRSVALVAPWLRDRGIVASVYVGPDRAARRLSEPLRGATDRTALAGILFVLKSGIPGEMLLAEMGCGSGMSCCRRLRDWHAAGV